MHRMRRLVMSDLRGRAAYAMGREMNIPWASYQAAWGMGNRMHGGYTLMRRVMHNVKGQ